MRIEPSNAVLTATRRWLEPVRAALGPEFLAAYVTGSALNQGFDERRSRVNVLIVSRSLNHELVDLLPNSRYVECSDAGHTVAVEQPGWFTDRVEEFLLG